MTAAIRIGFVVFALSLLSACATSGSLSKHLTPVATDPKPEPGKALVIFMRPSQFGFLIQSTVYDDTEYVATVSAGSRVGYQAKPGEHMFMVVGESADFMRAELMEGKTYYALVTPRMGAWKARFSLRPVNGDITQAELDAWMAETRPAVPNQQGALWAKKNHASVMAKHAEYLPQWKGKAEASRQAQTLRIDSYR